MSDHKRQRSILIFDRDCDSEVLNFISGFRTPRLRNKYLLLAIDYGIPGAELTHEELVWYPRTVLNRTDIRISVTRDFPNTYLKWLHLPTFMRLQAFRAYAKRGVPRIMRREAPPAPPRADLSASRPPLRLGVRDYEELPPEADPPPIFEDVTESLPESHTETNDENTLNWTQSVLMRVIGNQLDSEMETEDES